MKANPKKVMGRKMLTAKERANGVPYWRSAAWQKRHENIKAKAKKKLAIPSVVRRKSRAENRKRIVKAAQARRAERSKAR